MGDDLMAEEVEIDPFVRGSALLAAKQLPVKRARLGEIANGKSKVKSGAVGHRRVCCVRVREKHPRGCSPKREAGSADKEKSHGQEGVFHIPSRSQLAKRELLKIDGKPVCGDGEAQSARPAADREGASLNRRGERRGAVKALHRSRHRFRARRARLDRRAA